MGTKHKGLVSPQVVKVSSSSRSPQHEDEWQIAPDAMSERSLKPTKPNFRGLSQELITGGTKSFIQPKLTIGASGDRYEQEADRVASDVVQKIHSPHFTQQVETIQRQDEDEEKIQLKRNEAIGGSPATSELETSIQNARGNGQPLANNIRKPMEQSFGVDFSNVKVHTDAQSDQLNKSIQAKAFTTGQDVFFRQGAYNPNSRGGQELIAHELTHVLQQNGNDVIQRDGEDEVESLGKAFEKRGKAPVDEKPEFPAIRELALEPNYRRIMELYDSNWFIAKEHLAYMTFAKDQEEYAQRMKVMKNLLDYRKQETETVLSPVMLSVATDVLGGKSVNQDSFKAKNGDKGYSVIVDGKEIIDANAPGSQSLTSDIDISFGVPDHEEFEVDLVQQFNHAFRKRWKGIEAGVVFDVNAYSSGFMSKASGHLEGEGYEEELGDKHQKSLEKKQKQMQFALAFLPIRKFFDGKPDENKVWKLFKLDTFREITKHLKNKGMRKFVSSAIKDLNLIFLLTDKLHDETKTEMNQIKKDVKEARAEATKKGTNQPVLSEKHLEAVSGDILYEAQLHKIRDLLEKRKKIVEKIQIVQSEKVPSKKELKLCRDQLSKNLLDAEREQGKALVYANEAYYTAGAAIHVVKGMQSGGAIQLSSQQQMASLLMNIGYKLMHYEHNEHEGGQGRALVATSKYGERIRDVVKQGTKEHMEERQKETEKKGAGGLYNKDFDPKLHEILQDELSVLNQEKNLIVHYKKTKRLDSPSAREAKAQTDLGEEMSTEKQNDVYLTIAMKALAPYYEHEFQ